MKYVLLAVMAMGLTACNGLTLTGSQNQIEAILAGAAAGTYVVTISKDGQTIVTETWTCTQDGGKLTGCHKQ